MQIWKVVIKMVLFSSNKRFWHTSVLTKIRLMAIVWPGYTSVINSLMKQLYECLSQTFFLSLMMRLSECEVVILITFSFSSKIFYYLVFQEQ